MKTITLTSTGLTGKQWIKRLEKGSYNISNYAREFLDSKDFKPTKKGKTYEVAFLKVADLGKTSATTQELKDEAQKRGYGVPDHELACLMRESLSKEIEEMGVWYVAALSDPITVSGGFPEVLFVDRFDGGRWLLSYWAKPDYQWLGNGAFVFPVVAGGPQSLETGASESLSLESAIEFVKREGYKVIREY